MIKKLEETEGTELLSRNYIGHLAYIDQGSPYIIPITYFYDREGQYILSYSSEGHKIKAMRRNNQVSLCVDEIDSVNHWRSILVHGEYEEVEGSDAKFQLHRFSEGVKNVITKKEHRHLHFISEFSSKLETAGIPIVYRVKITEITGKFREG